MSLQPPTSPTVFQFGMNGQTFTVTVTWNTGSGALNNIKLDRDSGLTAYSGLAINGVVIGRPTNGGTLNVGAGTLSGLGFNTFSDIDGKPVTLVP